MEERDFNLLIVQAVKRDADFLIRRHNTIKIVEWKNLRRSMLQVEDWDTPANKINSFCGIFSSVNWLMGHSQPLFKRAVIRSFEKNGAFEGSNIYPNFSQIFSEIDNAAKELCLDGYEHKNVRDHLKFVIYPIIETNEILDCHIGFTVQDFFSCEDIILNVFHEDNDYIVSTVITDIFRDLQRFYEKDPIYPPRLRTLIIVDECRRIFPDGPLNSSYNHNPYNSMISFVTTRRSSGIGLIALTQEPQSAPSWLTNNSAFVISFPIGGEGRRHVKQLLNLTNEQAKYIDELPEQGTGVFRDRRFNRRYLLQVPSDLEIAPVTEKETEQIMLPYIKKMHHELEKKEGIAKEIQRQMQLQEKKQKSYTEKDLEKLRNVIFPETRLMLKILENTPYKNKTTLLSQAKISRKKFDMSLDWLIDNQCIAEVSCQSSKTKPSKFYPLTEKGYDLLKTPRSKRIPSPKMFKHTFYCIKVEEWLRGQGYNAKREWAPEEGFINSNQSSKDITVPQRIDVFASINGVKTAYEITLSFSNLELNLYKCFGIMKMDHVNIVCENKAAVDRARQKILKSKMPDEYKKKIEYVPISEIF